MAQKPPWQLVEQHWESPVQVWPRTLQLPPGRLAQVLPLHVPVQQSFPVLQDWPTSLQILSEQVPLTQLFRQQSVLVEQEPPFA